QLIPSGGLRVNNATRCGCLASCAAPATDAARSAKASRTTANRFTVPSLAEVLREESTMVNRRRSAPLRPQAPAPSEPVALAPTWACERKDRRAAAGGPLIRHVGWLVALRPVACLGDEVWPGLPGEVGRHIERFLVRQRVALPQRHTHLDECGRVAEPR